MEDGSWRQRLERAITESGRSWRDVSRSAGCSPGYLYGILREGKEPGLLRLLRIIAEIDASFFEIVHGVPMDATSERFLGLLGQISPEEQTALLDYLETRARNSPS